MTHPGIDAQIGLAAPDPLELLARPDKWYLGGAPALLFAPPAPVWEDSPGFWDEAHYLHFALQPVFTFALIDEGGTALHLHPGERDWRPDRAVRTHHAVLADHARGSRHDVPTQHGEVEVVESRTCGPDDVLSDVVSLRNLGDRPRELRLVVWTCQPISESSWRSAHRASSGKFVNGEGHDDGALVIERIVDGLRGTKRALALALHLEGARSWSLDLAEAVPLQPHYHLTPYPETLGVDGLPNRANLGGVNRDGQVFAALERPITLSPGGSAVVRIRAAVAPDSEEAERTLRAATATDPLEESKRAWREYFSSVPRFACADEHLQTYYYYRWYGLRLNAISRRIGNYRHPAVAEGIGYFRVPISYSAQCHMLETRWMKSPDLAMGSFRNFVDNQRSDGSFPNHIHVDHVAPEGIYHADWGSRVLDVHDVHPDSGFLRDAYDGLERYLDYFYRERDREVSGLYDHINQWESGQEYMSRYVWVDAEADQWKPMSRRLKGVDATTYIYRCEQAMARIAEKLGLETAGVWRERARRTGRAILDHCWRDDLQAFVDLSPELEPSELVFATSFYPFFTDLVDEKHLASIRRWLLDPDRFWTEYPVPASPRTDPQYSPTPAWRGKRTNCPWNGRTWPMTNSHVAEALAHASDLDPELRTTTAEFIQRFIRMMSFNGDPSRPNCFEHYNPETGTPSTYRGFDDYMHSWVVDLLIKYLGGVRPSAGGVVIDPFPFGTHFAFEGIRIRGRNIDVSFGEEGFLVQLDGGLVHEGSEPTRVEIPLQ